MSMSRKIKWIFAVSLAAGLTSAMARFVANGTGRNESSNGAEPSQGMVMPDITPPRKQTPLDCRIVLAGGAELRAAMEQWGLFQRRPERLTPRILQNPLLTGHVYGKVEIENTSGRDFAMTANGGPLFWVSARVEDADGRSISFDQSSAHSLKRINFTRPLPALKTLAPGQVESQDFDFLGACPPETDVKPGRYTVRAVCSYYRAPGGEDARVESRPVPFTITADDIREWRAFFREVDLDKGEEEVKPEP